ncbi:hypothetical protein CR3_1385 [Cupriavidus gilardii CR3]|nr:hypothetical protein CR3_1385 [Cupriavidus gilardii CR3]SOZ96712.1 hypothetical protein CBM2598_U20012 [Cupriavidus taiwanensis]
MDIAIVVMMMRHVLGVDNHMVQHRAGRMRELPLHCSESLQREHQHQKDGNNSRHAPDSTGICRRHWRTPAA